jgi:putative transposase
MVRAGVVDHPSEWPDCGYHEIQDPRQRYTIINRQKLAELAMLGDVNSLKESHTGWLLEMLSSQGNGREEKWSSSVAVGGEKFVSKIKQLLGVRATGRRIVNISGGCELREPSSPYNGVFIPENVPLRFENMYYWDIYPDNTMG